MSAYGSTTRTRRAETASSITLNQGVSSFPRSAHDERTGFAGTSGSNQVGGIFQCNITARTLLRRTYKEGRAGLGADVVATSTGNGSNVFRDSDSGKVDARADLSKAGAILRKIQ
jgi:hypothetical protein